MIVTLTKNLTLPYFKCWANGVELVDEVENDDYFVTFPEEHKKNACFVYEGQVEDIILLSDLLDTVCASNKHHYAVPVDKYNECFTVVKTVERRPEKMSDINFSNTRQGKVFFNDVKRLSESTASIADTMKAISNQLAALIEQVVNVSEAVKEVGSSIIFKK